MTTKTHELALHKVILAQRDANNQGNIISSPDYCQIYYDARLEAELDSPALVEDVAKALSQWRHDRNLGLPTWDELEEHVKKAYRDQAQAALQAIKKAGV